MDELARVLRPGGTIAVTVPGVAARAGLLALSDEYHAPVRRGRPRAHLPGGRRCGRGSARQAWSRARAHRAHALHSPYWWLRCAVGPTNETNRAVRGVPQGPGVGHRRQAPKPTRWTDRALNPVLGKSLVVYARKPGAVTAWRGDDLCPRSPASSPPTRWPRPPRPSPPCSSRAG